MALSLQLAEGLGGVLHQQATAPVSKFNPVEEGDLQTFPSEFCGQLVRSTSPQTTLNSAFSVTPRRWII